MKTLNLAAKAAILAMLLLSTGTLFFSCVPTTNDDYGTLVVTVPGVKSNARTAVSVPFKGTLSCRIECTGPGGSVSRHAGSGDSPVISLMAGDWTVKVTVLNAAGEDIGSASSTVSIESGKTTTVTIPIRINTSGNAITRFSVTGPFSAEGGINAGTHSISVSVPMGTDCSAVYFSAVHTGVSINPASGPLNLISPQTLTVTAENGTPQTWIVKVEFVVPSFPGSTASWPSAATLSLYGLGTLTRPGSTRVHLSVVSSGALFIYLEDAAKTDYDTLVTGIEGMTSGGTTVKDNFDATNGYGEFERTYTLSGEGFTLNMEFASGLLMLTVEPDNPAAFAVWPDGGKWAEFNLAGLTQSAGTAVLEVTEIPSPAVLTVRLRNVTHASYEDLLAQITAKFGSPISTTGGAADPQRGAAFMTTSPSTIVVALTMDTADDEIEITASKM
jgi:hypothetical protein